MSRSENRNLLETKEHANGNGLGYEIGSGKLSRSFLSVSGGVLSLYKLITSAYYYIFYFWNIIRFYLDLMKTWVITFKNSSNESINSQ